MTAATTASPSPCTFAGRCPVPGIGMPGMPVIGLDPILADLGQQPTAPLDVALQRGRFRPTQLPGRASGIASPQDAAGQDESVKTYEQSA